MNRDVTIPADVARDAAALLRRFSSADTADLLHARLTADLLDPKPPTLRDEVMAVIRTAVAAAYPDRTHDAPEWDEEQADAVLSVVKARIEALPLMPVARRGFVVGDVISSEQGGLLLTDVLALFGDES